MPTISLQEAQAKLPEVLEHLQPGEELTITDHGEPLAQVKKLAQSNSPSLRPPPGLGKGMVSILADDEEHLQDFAEYMP